ncbi:MAG: beta-ketoacyl synthase N-terminal-like domain-containing protein, partial [Chloroflexota bacterium]
MTPGFENLDLPVRPRRRDRRVVVTGMGVISPIGNTLEEYWRGLLTGKSGIARVTFCDPSDYPTKIAGEVKDFDPTLYLNPKEARRLARFTQFAVAATRMALAHAQIDLAKLKSDRAGVLLGNGNGGFPTVEEGVRALVAVPLLGGQGRVVGALCVFDVKPLRIDTPQLEALKALGRDFGRA